MAQTDMHDDTIGPGQASPAPAPRRRRARTVLLLILGAVLLLLVVWFVHYRTTGRFMQTTNDAYVQADAVVVSAKVNGYVDRVFVADNQEVSRGQPLLQIDPRDYRAQAAQVQAQIDVAGANAEGIEAQIREQQAAVARAQSDVAAASNDAAFARSEVVRYTPLAASGAETRERLTQLQNEARQAEAKLSGTRASLVSAQRRIGTLQAQVRQARSQGRASRAQLAAADVNVGATLIRASSDGRVGDKSVQVGQLAQAGTRLMSIVPTRQLYIEANFKETQVGLMRVGQPVTISVDALDGVEIHGHVESLSPGTGAQFSLIPPQNATGNFTKIVQRVPVRIAVDAGAETRRVLLPGMSAEVTVDTRAAAGAIDRIRREQDAHNEARAR